MFDDHSPIAQDDLWKLLSAGAAVTAALAVRAGLAAGWRGWRGDDPPRNPADGDTGWRDALLWAGATGLLVAVARVGARRAAAAGWEAVTGSSPP